MRVLILGANGMLGHKLYQVLGEYFDVTGTIRGDYRDVARYGFFEQSRIFPDADAMEISGIAKIVQKARPDVVVNAIGVVKALEKQSGVLVNIHLNALFPHQLYQTCRAHGIRLIQISTDCVFSGRKGYYREEDLADAEDIYGKTKYLGEVSGDGALTVRTSFIGRELSSSNGLLEWFLSNQGGSVPGYTKAIFSGFPTLLFSRIIADIIMNHGNLSGVYHVSSESISKFQLLNLINRAMGLNIEVKEYPEVEVDRSLDSTRYRQETGFTPPPWEQMIEELAQDAEQYLKWR